MPHYPCLCVRVSVECQLVVRWLQTTSSTQYDILCLCRLATDMERAQEEGWCFGAKLVRGAYMFMERDRARQMGYISPVHDSIDATHANYNECVLPLVYSLLVHGAFAQQRQGRGHITE